MHAKRMRGEASRRKRRRESGSSIETRKPATLRPRNEHPVFRTAGTPCWFSYFQGGYMTIVKVPPQIADLRREVLAATTVVSCPVFAPVITADARTPSVSNQWPRGPTPGPYFTAHCIQRKHLHYPKERMTECWLSAVVLLCGRSEF